jgi:hypothetical protein
MAQITDTSETMRRAQGNRPAPTFMERWIAAMRDVLADLTSPYRPERHYMRGGGTGGVT